MPRPIFFRGEQVGEWRHFDERLTMWLLRYRHPRRYGAWRDQLPPPTDPEEDAEAEQLDWLLGEFDGETGENGENGDEASDDGDNAPSRE